jgi:hypothetical protein
MYTRAKAKGDSSTLWDLANSTIGKPKTDALPKFIEMSDGKTMTDGPTAAANRMNEFYIEKVLKLRERNVGYLPPATSWPEKSSEYTFAFCTAGKICKVIKGLGNTEAVGHNMIPVSVYKRGVNILSSPISHVINCSFASGKVPSSLRQGIIVPYFKGHGKNRCLAASYRPVSLLPALSKVLEVVAKESLEQDLASNNAPSNKSVWFPQGKILLDGTRFGARGMVGGCSNWKSHRCSSL